MPRSKPSPRTPSKSSTAKSPVPKRPNQPQSGDATKSNAPKSRPAKRADLNLTTLLAESIRDRTFLRLVLSQPANQSDSAVSKVTVRLVEINGQTKYQWSARANSQEKHQNLTADELVVQTKGAFGSQFHDAHLFTTEADLTIRWNYGKPQQVKRKPPTQRVQEAADHNRQKQYLIPAGVPCPFLIEIGVMLPSGQVKPTMYNKFKQINRYLEFVEDLLPQLPASGPIHVVDFGCGKSYLTFALYHLLTAIHQRQVSIVGLDVKAEVIEDCTRVAQALNCQGLEFQFGRIENYSPTTHVHLAVSLHACDTATDDALAAALRWGSEAILAVPCCQHEVCQTMGRQTLPGLTEYGLLKERFASLATDALRAQFLDLHGYRTQVLEFIETEHTPKNILIRAVKRSDVASDLASRQAAYDQLKSILGLTSWHLEQVHQDNQPG